MRIDVLDFMEIKICLKKTAKPQREWVGGSRGQLEAHILVSPAHTAFQMRP